MSASEKLRALDAAMIPREQWSCWIPNDSYESYGILERQVEWAICDLRNALPLIADVVEAAEVYAPVIWRRDATDQHTLNGIELQRRLTALREHLE